MQPSAVQRRDWRRPSGGARLPGRERARRRHRGLQDWREDDTARQDLANERYRLSAAGGDPRPRLLRDHDRHPSRARTRNARSGVTDAPARRYFVWLTLYLMLKFALPLGVM